MTKKKEIFTPRNGNRVKLFVCGPTVYNHSHIGHARTYISFDIIVRYLKFKGYSVFYLQNITDIDDKIIKRAEELGVNPRDLAIKFEEKYLQDMARLGVNTVNLYARATEHINEIISQIETLLKKGYAYETETGVYFDESKFPEFGKLSRRKIEDLNVHRVNKDSTKKNPGDFALWKKKKNEPLWDSPWGKGRPGWHIEDTAITEEYFGPQYDIHGGGLDLIFPHHEAEIAQMESVSGLSPMVNYWIHTGFLNVGGEKMSKSQGNFITIQNLLESYSPEVFRFFVLSTHYRSPIDFSQKALKQAENSLKRIKKTLELIDEKIEQKEVNDNFIDYSSQLAKLREDFFSAMDNDFNTPHALSVIFNFIRKVNKDVSNKNISKNSLKSIKNQLLEFGSIFGFEFYAEIDEGNSEELINIILEIREKLREKKEWELSDKIRENLTDMGINIEDK